MDDLGVPLFQETTIYIHLCSYFCSYVWRLIHLINFHGPKLRYIKDNHRSPIFVHPQGLIWCVFVPPEDSCSEFLISSLPVALSNSSPDCSRSETLPNHCNSAHCFHGFGLYHHSWIIFQVYFTAWIPNLSWTTSKKRGQWHFWKSLVSWPIFQFSAESPFFFYQFLPYQICPSSSILLSFLLFW